MFIKGFKASLTLVAFIIMSACTNASVEQDLRPQPITAQPAPTTNTQQAVNQVAGQTANPTALAPQATPTPSQNVAEAQLQQQVNQQVQSTGLADTTQPTVASLTPTAPAQVPSIDASKALSFLPFEGAPQNKATSFNRFLNTTAQTNGLTVFPPTRSGAKYKVKGYFSALNDGTGTLLVYVWDVTDSTGKRLHRINGRERTGTSRSDPWQAITDREIQRVAATTTAKLKSWIDRRS